MKPENSEPRKDAGDVGSLTASEAARIMQAIRFAGAPWSAPRSSNQEGGR